jgi:O-antigen/teichoic acid export membrane protein
MNFTKLIKKAGLYFIGNMSAKLIAVILIPLYAFFVTSEDLGTYDYAQTVMNILVPIIYLSIWEAVLKYLLTNKEKINEIIATSITYVGLVSILFVIVGFVYLKFTQNKMILLIFLIMVSYIISYIWQYFARGFQENNIYVLASIVGAFTNFLLTVFFLCFLKLGIYSLFASFIIAQISIAVVIEIKCRFLKHLKLNNINPKLFKEMIKFSGPLVLNTLSYWFITGYGRLVITNTLGSKMNGLYSFANKFAMIITITGQVIAMALIEEAVLKAKNKSSELGSYFYKVLTILFRIFMSLIIIGVPVITILYQMIKNTEYSESLKLIPFFLLYSTYNILALNVGSIFQAINKTKYLFTTTLIGAILTILISNLLINRMGIYGIAIGQIVGALGMLIARYYISNKQIYILLDLRPIAFLTLLYILIGYFCVNVNWWINIIVIMIIIPLLLFVNKKEILYLVRKFKDYISNRPNK